MNTLKTIMGLGLAVATVLACNPSGKELKTETFEFADSTAHAHLSIKAELPVPGAADAVRARLIDVMDRHLSHIGTYEEERQFPAFEGNAADSKALMAYYQAKSLETLGRMAQEDYDERVESISENDGITEEEKKDILSDMPGWEYDFSLTKDRETDRYVVFLSEDYVYLGGAHGGIIGCGPLTFDKKDGHLVEKFLEASSLQEIQPLLRKGLVEYFSEDGEAVQPEQLDDWLMLEGGLIPFPSWTPYPSEDGLVFTYQQYEIASYAAGMPSFTLSYDDVLPFLTEDAKKLISQ